MAYGNGVAPAPEAPSNGRMTIKIHPIVATIVFSLLTFGLGMLLDSTRSSATLDTKVSITADQQKQMVTKDQFEQFQTDTKEALRRIETELDAIRSDAQNRHR